MALRCTHIALKLPMAVGYVAVRFDYSVRIYVKQCGLGRVRNLWLTSNFHTVCNIYPSKGLPRADSIPREVVKPFSLITLSAIALIICIVLYWVLYGIGLVSAFLNLTMKWLQFTHIHINRQCLCGAFGHYGFAAIVYIPVFYLSRTLPLPSNKTVNELNDQNNLHTTIPTQSLI